MTQELSKWDELLLKSAGNGDLKSFNKALANKANVNSKYFLSGDSALMLILSQEDNFETNSRLGKYIIRLILRKKYRKMFEKLLADKSININSLNENGLTPLVRAIFRNDEKSVKMLLNHKTKIQINPNPSNKKEDNALNVAMLQKNEKIIRMILDHEDIDVNAWNGLIQGSALENVILCMVNSKHKKEKKTNIRILKMLLDHPEININSQDCENETLFEKAVRNENEKIVEMFLNHPKVDEISSKDKALSGALQAIIFGKNPLKSSQKNIVKKLIEAGAKTKLPSVHLKENLSFRKKIRTIKEKESNIFDVVKKLIIMKKLENFEKIKLVKNEDKLPRDLSFPSIVEKTEEKEKHLQKLSLLGLILPQNWITTMGKRSQANLIIQNLREKKEFLKECEFMANERQ